MAPGIHVGYESRPIAKGLAPKIGELLSKTSVIFSARRKLLELNRKSLIPFADYNIVLRTFRRAVLRLIYLLGPWLGTHLKLELWFRPPRRPVSR